MSTSLYVSNLPASATAETLSGTFAQFGTVLSVKLKRDPGTGRLCNYGFVEMKTPEEARRAVADLLLVASDQSDNGAASAEAS